MAIVLSSLATDAPAGLGQWTHIAPPTGPSILAIDPTAPGTLYSEAYRTVDGGRTWVPTGFLPPYVADLVVDPLMPSRIYAAMKSLGVYVSVDGASSWTPSNTGLPHFDSTTVGVLAIVPDPAAAGTVYCTVWGTGVFKSTNGGASWTPTGTIGMSNLQLTALAIDPSSPATMYAGAQTTWGSTSTVPSFKSIDGGASWMTTGLVNEGLFGSEMRVHELVVHPTSPQTVYALIGAQPISWGPPSAIAKSTDGGATFTHSAPPVYTTGRFAVDPVNPARVYAGTNDGVYTSDDGAATWTYTSSGLDAVTSPAVVDLAVDPTAPDTVYAALSSAGRETVFKTTDASHWAPSGRGFPLNTGGGKIVIDPDESTRLYAGFGGRGRWRSDDAGANWIPQNLGVPRDESPASLVLDPHTPSTIYALYGSSGLFKSVDRGTIYHPVSSDLPSLPFRVLAMDPATPSTMYVGGEGVAEGDPALFRSVDGGASWSSASTGLNGEVVGIAIDPVTTSTLYAGTTVRLYKSTDSGASWTATSVTVPTFPQSIVGGGSVRVLAIDPSAPVTIYAATNASALGPGPTYYQYQYHDLRKSVDGGASWMTITNGLSAVTDLVIDPQTPATLYAATGSGVFRSVDAGGHWTALVPIPQSNIVSALAIDPERPSWLYASSSYGLYRIEGPCVVDADCTDGNPCTTDTCNPDGSCAIDAVTDGQSCDDEDACSATSACDAGRCVPSAPLPICDDGILCTADACSPLDGTCVTTFRSALCDDDDACTVGDHCSMGGCVSGTPVTCDLCLTCDPSVGCAEIPDPTCAVAAPGKAQIAVKDEPRAGVFGHLATWKWKSAAPMSFADFGDPLASTDYALCIYDSSANGSALVVREQVTADHCAFPCWKRAGNALKFRSGANSLDLKTNGAGIGVVKLKARQLFVDGGLPFAVDPNVTVQLRRTDAPACWQATYPSARTNTDRQFKAKAP